jgi:hypothetical protein
VEEVIAWVQDHHWHEVMHDQLHFADATGDAVVISAGPDGEVAFTRKSAGDGFLVSTNFNVANPSNGSTPCWRYARAERMLSEIQSENELTAKAAAAVAEAVHVESPSGWTIYSVVADLPQRLVYVYYMFQYDAPIVLSVDDEIARPRPSHRLSELFPDDTRQRANKAFERLMARTARCDRVGLTWLGLVALSLVGLLLVPRSGRGRMALWVPLVAVLGPLGLLARMLVDPITGRGGRASILAEAVGDLPPYVVGLMTALLTVFLVPRVTQNQLLQLLVFYGIPVALALLFYQPLLLTRATGSGYGRTVWRRLPAVVVSTNLALAGLLAVGLPLIQWQLNTCGISPWIILAWWIIAALSALAGGLLLYGYHAWAVRRGFTAWSALLVGAGSEIGDEGATVSSPPWRRVWPWVLLSFAILIAGVVAGVWGTMLAAGTG